MQTLIVPSDQIRDMEGLSLLVAGLERVTGGGKINVRQAVVIETECVPAYFMLQDLLVGKGPAALPAPDPLAEIPAPEEDPKPKPKKQAGSLYNRGSQPGKLHRHNHTKPGKSISLHGTYPGGDRPALKAHRHVIPAWKVTYIVPEDYMLKVGDMFTGQAVGKGVKNGRILPGTRFHHPKFGNLVVDENRCLVSAGTGEPA